MTQKRRETLQRYRDKNKIRHKERYARTTAKKEAWLWKFVKCKCVVCGEKEPCCLQFHHKDPSKKIKEIALLIKLKNTDMSDTVKEIVKCVLLCANCHFKVHSKLIDIKKLPLIKVNVNKMIKAWDGRGAYVKINKRGTNQFSVKETVNSDEWTYSL